jgi:hypothetical protein
VAEQIGMTTRHTQRLLNVIAAPMEVQLAYSARRLKIEMAEKVYRLAGNVQEKIAAEIRAGGVPGEIVRALLPKPEPKASALGPALGQLVSALARGMEILDGRLDEIDRDADDLAQDLDVLGRFTSFRRKLFVTLKAKRARRARFEQDLEEFADEIRQLRHGPRRDR